MYLIISMDVTFFILIYFYVLNGYAMLSFIIKYLVNVLLHDSIEWAYVSLTVFNVFYYGQIP